MGALGEASNARGIGPLSEAVRVCHIITGFHPVIGGAERATEDLCQGLLTRGLDVVVVTRRGPGSSRYEKIAGISVHRPGYPSWSKLGALTFGLQSLWLLATQFRDYRVIHVQNIHTPLLVGLLSKALLGRNLVVTIQAEAQIVSRMDSRLGRLRVRLMCLLADMFGAVSPELRGQFLREGVPSANIRLIPNGIDNAVFHPSTEKKKREVRSRLHLNDSHVIVLYVGRLIPTKRVDLLLQAWSRLSSDQPATLLIVGDGPEQQPLERLANRLELDTVRFEGRREDVSSYLRAADVFVLPSQEEGLSVALLEAMATGLAVVVTDLPGNQSIVHHRENGLIFPVDDLEALVDLLNSSVQSTGIRERLGKNAHDSVYHTYSVETVARQYHALYEEVLAKAG